MLISIIGTLWALAYALILLYIIILYFTKIVSFLRNRERLKNSDADNIAFSLQRDLSSGNHETVYGIFNKRTSQIIDGEKVQSEDIDADLKNIHALKELAVYN